MDKIGVRGLCLEVTRRCTLNCKHCMKGDSKKEDMSHETIDSIFKDVNDIQVLLFSGGEPFLAIDQLEYILNVIKRNNIHVYKVRIVTNATILNSRILKLLKELSKISKLDIKVSLNKFHQMEVDRIGATKKRDSNLNTLKELFNAKEYGREINNDLPKLLLSKGRAAQLSAEELEMINNSGEIKTNYTLDKDIYYGKFINDFEPKYDENDRIAYGEVFIDVNGNIIYEACSYDEEDEQSCSEININQVSIIDALNSVKRKRDKDLELLLGTIVI